MSAHPFGRPRQQLGRRTVAMTKMARLVAICAIATIMAVGAVVVGIDIGQLELAAEPEVEAASAGRAGSNPSSALWARV